MNAHRGLAAGLSVARSRRGQLATLIAVGLAVRYILFPWVGVWGDLGFYTYDARLILAGQQPFVDFVGRSPLFNYLYAAAVAVFGQPAHTVRWFIIAWWVLAAVPVYAIARHIRSHRAGLAAAAMALLAPMALVYGMWANTQSLAALLAITAACVLVRRTDHAGYALAGGLLGLAFLSRRSVIAVAAGVGLWTVWDWRAVRPVVTRGLAAGLAFLVVIVTGYAAMAGGDPIMTVKLAETHAIGLLSSGGRGGFPLITDLQPPNVGNELSGGGIPIVNDLCQLCGTWTARTFAKTTIVALPAVGVALVYLRYWSAALFATVHRQVLAGTLLTLGGYGVIVTLLAGYPARALGIVALAAGAAVIWRVDPLPRDDLADRHALLMVAILAMLAAAYLYRERILHTYYFMDFWPFLAVLAGITYDALGERLAEHAPGWRALAVGALVLAVVVSTAGAFPLMNVVTGNDAGWFTMSNLDDSQEYMTTRVDGDGPIFSGHPSYVAGTDIRLLFDMPRVHYYATTFNGSVFGQRLHERLQQAFGQGRARWAIGGPMTEAILELDNETEQAFVANYCRVEDPTISQTGGKLYHWQPDCPAERVPVVENMSDAN